LIDGKTLLPISPKFFTILAILVSRRTYFSEVCQEEIPQLMNNRFKTGFKEVLMG
jgi:hypothetical protein